MNAQDVLQRVWRSRNLLAIALLPAAWAYGLLARLDRQRQRTRRRAPAVPVIVVGNAVVGGGGKTPVVIELVHWLRAQGWHPGVISRGYGRSQDGSSLTRLVEPDADPREVGDEPLLLRQRTGSPLVVGANRLQAVAALWAAAPATDIVVSDDGLQHHALDASLRICVWDRAGLGNGWLLPAGPLREPWPPQADFFLCSDDDGTGPGAAPRTRSAQQATPDGSFVVRRRLAQRARNASGQTRSLAELAAHPVQVWTGIARPERFIQALRVAGFQLAEVQRHPDHYHFDSESDKPDARYPLICTEKDAVKLWRRFPQAWAVALELEVDPSFWEALAERLRPLSSGDGPQAA